MNNNIKLSVIVLVYNTEEYIRDCLDSLVNQTLDGIEIIAVNDESPDNCHIILDEYEKKYDNITVVNQKNSGGAVAGTNGMKRAKGKYIAIVDSDDILPLNAYEKLYLKAESESADIVIGRAHIIKGGNEQPVIYKKERDVWKKERVITNIGDNMDIIHDGFYWNKIFNREMMISNNIYMPDGMLYADRPMVHKAYLYAKKICIIPELVYLWRKRVDENNKSITQLKTDIKNLQDRLESLNYQLNYFSDKRFVKYKNEFLKHNLERLLFPIAGIIKSKSFRELYITESKKIFEQVKDLYNNDLSVKNNLIIYFIMNDYREELIYYLVGKVSGKLIKEGEFYYREFPFFRNNELNIPDEIFMVKDLSESLIDIDSIKIEDNRLVIEDIIIPENIKVDFVRLCLESENDPNDIFEFIFDRTNNHFNLNIDLKEKLSITKYKAFIIVKCNGKEQKIRINKKMFSLGYDIIKDEFSSCALRFNKLNNLCIDIMKDIDASIILEEDRVLVRTTYRVDDNVIVIYLEEKNMGEKYYFIKVNNYEYELKYSHFLESDTSYDLCCNYFGNEVKINIDSINFKPNNEKRVPVDFCKFVCTKK